RPPSSSPGHRSLTSARRPPRRPRRSRSPSPDSSSWPRHRHRRWTPHPAKPPCLRPAAHASRVASKYPSRLSLDERIAEMAIRALLLRARSFGLATSAEDEAGVRESFGACSAARVQRGHRRQGLAFQELEEGAAAGGDVGHLLGDADRKSTRLNSSHVKISYAVFCLK